MCDPFNYMAVLHSKGNLTFITSIGRKQTSINWWLASESCMGRILSFVKFFCVYGCLTCTYLFNLMTVFTLKVWIFDYAWKIIRPANRSPYCLISVSDRKWVVVLTLDGACAPPFTRFPPSLPYSFTLLVCPLEEFEFEKLGYTVCSSSLFPLLTTHKNTLQLSTISLNIHNCVSIISLANSISTVRCNISV